MQYEKVRQTYPHLVQLRQLRQQLGRDEVETARTGLEG